MSRAALLLAVLAGAGAGQEDALRLRFAGEEAGRETFRVESLPGGGRRLTGRSEIAVGGERLTIDYVLLAGPTGSPWFSGYEVETRFESKERTVRLEAFFAEGVLRIASGEESESVEGWPGRGLVLDANAVGPFALLLEAYDDELGGAQNLPVLVPQLGGGMKVTLERRGAAGDLVRWFLAAPGHGATLWSDAEGHLVGYENPSARLSAWREDTSPPRVSVPGGEAVVLRAPGGREISGDLHSGPRPARDAPGVLLLSDAGRDDRRGNPVGTDFRWDHLEQLAESLAAVGAVVLSFDDPEGRGAMSDRVADARTALEFLDRKTTGPLAVVGHGEGGLVAVELARARPGPAAIALLSTPARPFAEILLEREVAALAARGATERDLEQYRAGRRTALERIAASNGDEMETDVGRLEVRELRERLRYQSLERLAGLTRPVLVLSPASEAAEAELFRRALTDLRHPDVSVRLVEGVDSLLLPVRFGPADLSDSDRRLAPEAVQAVQEFLARSLRR